MNNKANAKSHAHVQIEPTVTRAKIAKEYVFANTNNKTEKVRKYNIGIANSGYSIEKGYLGPRKKLSRHERVPNPATCI